MASENEKSPTGDPTAEREIKLLPNGAVVSVGDDGARILVRLVYAEPGLADFLLSAVKAYEARNLRSTPPTTKEGA